MWTRSSFILEISLLVSLKCQLSFCAAILWLSDFLLWELPGSELQQVAAGRDTGLSPVPCGVASLAVWAQQNAWGSWELGADKNLTSRVLSAAGMAPGGRGGYPNVTLREIVESGGSMSPFGCDLTSPGCSYSHHGSWNHGMAALGDYPVPPLP